MKNSKIKRIKKYSNRINSKKGGGFCDYLLCRDIRDEARKCEKLLKEKSSELKEQKKILEEKFRQKSKDVENLDRKKKRLDKQKKILNDLLEEIQKNVQKQSNAIIGKTAGGGLFCGLCKDKKKEFEETIEHCKTIEKVDEYRKLIDFKENQELKYKTEIDALEKEIENIKKKSKEIKVGGYYRKSHRKSYKKLRKNSRRNSHKKLRRNSRRNSRRK